MAERVYIAIDLKSFYASVECMARGLDPLTTHLVVADAARTEKTICLAVSPSLRTYGIPGRTHSINLFYHIPTGYAISSIARSSFSANPIATIPAAASAIGPAYITPSIPI